MGDRLPKAETDWAPEDRLDSWKAIASYLNRDVTTVQRWEKRERLPVHRHVHERLATVFTYRSELDRWLHQRQQPQLRAEPKRRWMLLAAAGVVLLASIALFFWPRVPSRSRAMTSQRLWQGPDTDRFGSFSRDGNVFSFTDPTTGDLTLRDLPSGRTWPITSRSTDSRWETALTSSVAPTGDRVAYSWYTTGLECDLRVVDSDGSNQRVLLRDPKIAIIRVGGWSPDGQRVLASLSRGVTTDLVMVDVDSASVRVLKTLGWRTPSRFVFSPDGRWIAYDIPAVEGKRERDIWVMRLGENGALAADAPLVDDPADDSVLEWAGGGEALLYLSDRSGTYDAWMRHVGRDRTREPLLVKKELGRVLPLGITPQSTFFYGLRIGLTNVFTAAMDPAASRIDTPMPAKGFAGSNRTPAWSQDGRLLAYVTQREHVGRWLGLEVTIHTTAGDPFRTLATDLNQIEQLAWAPGPALLASGSDTRTGQGVFRISPDTGAITRLFSVQGDKDYLHEVAWHPDQRHVYYRVRQMHAEPGRLMIWDTVKAAAREVLPAVYRFALSLDGSTVAFSRYVGNGMQALFVVPEAGGSPREICRIQGQIAAIAWTRNNRALLFARRNEIWRVAAGGGRPERVALAGDNVRELRIHPDGSRLAFAAGNAMGEVWSIENIAAASTARR